MNGCSPQSMKMVIFREAVAAYFAYAEGLSSIAIRIGCFDQYPPEYSLNSYDLSRFVTRRDLSHLLVQCIEVPDIQFAIVHGISDNFFKQLDLAETKKLLNYQPQDDSFEIFDVGLNDT
jgi:NAD+ dependent glucose-6-phosphate dehydrogenase